MTVTWCKPFDYSSTQPIVEKEQVVSGLLAHSKWLFWTLFYICCILIIVTFIAGWSWMLLTIISADCSNNGRTYYPSSSWTEVIEFIQPYCHMEYHGYPPVWKVPLSSSSSSFQLVTPFSFPVRFQFVFNVVRDDCSRICNTYVYQISNKKFKIFANE